MFHFNTITRTHAYEQLVRGEGLDSCFDCASEALVLQQYLERHRGMPPGQERDREVERICDTISKACSSTKSGRSLVMPGLGAHYQSH